jgi:hypothetical protein
MKRSTALLVPGGQEVCRLVFRKLEAERRGTLPECLQAHLETFLGWYFSSYNFQKAIDAATSPQGQGKLFLLRSLTLVPLGCVCDDCHVYGVLRRGSLAIESLGGPWEVKLHRGGACAGAERAFLLSHGRDSSLSLGRLSIRDSVDRDAAICPHLFFREASATRGELPGAAGGAQARGTASLSAFNRLGRGLSAGDRLVARRGLCLDSRIIRAGSTGVVKAMLSDVLGPLFLVEWSVGAGEQAETFVLSHWNRLFLEVEATTRREARTEGPGEGGGPPPPAPPAAGMLRLPWPLARELC